MRKWVKRRHRQHGAGAAVCHLTGLLDNLSCDCDFLILLCSVFLTGAVCRLRKFQTTLGTMESSFVIFFAYLIFMDKRKLIFFIGNRFSFILGTFHCFGRKNPDRRSWSNDI